MKKIVMLLCALVLLALALVFVVNRTPASCADEPQHVMSTRCVADHIKGAELGDARAMYRLALYFEDKDPQRAAHWLKRAIVAGDPVAAPQILSECGPGKLFTVAEAQRILAESAKSGKGDGTLNAMYFELGMSCRPAHDLHRVRELYGRGVSDGLLLCAVAQKYGQLVLDDGLDLVDQKNAVDLLKGCLTHAGERSVAAKVSTRLLSDLEALANRVAK